VMIAPPVMMALETMAATGAVAMAKLAQDLQSSTEGS
jgi:hypothetical protein